MTGWPSALGDLFAASRSGTSRRKPRTCSTGRRRRRRRRRIYRLARGHPLSLRLAASALAERPGVSLEAVTVQAIVEGLTELYLGVLDRRRARRSTPPRSCAGRRSRCLRRCCPETAPQDAFDRLRALPFVESATTGWSSTTRSARRSLPCSASSDPDRSAIPCRRMAPAPRGGRAASNQEMWRIRPTCCTSSRTRSSARRSSRRPSTCSRSRSPRPADGRRSRRSRRVHAAGVGWRPRRVVAPGARGLPGRARPAGRRRRLRRRVRDRHREPRLVARGPGRSPMCWDHLRRHPVPRGQRVLFSRTWLGRDSARRLRRAGGELARHSSARTWSSDRTCGASTRSCRTSRRRPDGRRPSVSSCCRATRSSWTASPYYALLLDFGPSSVDGWLARLVAASCRSRRTRSSTWSSISSCWTAGAWT